MKENYKTQFMGILFLITILIAGIATVYGGYHFNSNVYVLQEETILELSSGWQYQTDAGRQEISNLPATIKLDKQNGAVPDSLTIYYRLPDEMPINPVLEFMSRQMTVEVFVDNQLIYNHGLETNAPVGGLLGNSWNVVSLPGDTAGKEISIRLTAPYSPGIYHIGDISMGSRAGIIGGFIRSNIGLIIFCLLSAFTCILIWFIVIFFKIKKVNLELSPMAFFALFIFISTTWVITDSNVLQLLTSNFAVVYFISHITFMLMPIPLMIFLFKTTLYGKNVYGILGIMYMLGFVLRIGLFFGGLANLETTLIITHIMMAAGVVVCIVTIIKEWCIYHDKTTLFFLTGFIALVVCLIISLLVFFIALDLNYAIYFRIMLLLMMIAMFYRTISRLEAMVKKGIEAHTYHQMAYIDALTNLYNRTAFEERMKSLQKERECYTLTFVIFDINRLKHVNDTYGHSAGDQLIKCAADCISEKFAHIGTCYRIGGDEFVVILMDFSEKSLEKIMEEFQEYVAQANPGNPEGLSVAADYATGPASGDNFAYILFNEADKRMYIQKEKTSGKLK